MEHTYRRFCNQFFKQSKKNLGINFDGDLSSSSHVNALIRTMYLELRKLGKIRHLINTDSAALLVSSLVLSILDYCNPLLAGLPSERLKRLQTVQNNTARLVKKKKNQNKTRLPNTSSRDPALASSCKKEFLIRRQLGVTSVFMAMPLLI